jgi:very-short-patch-repair endonuclease
MGSETVSCYFSGMNTTVTSFILGDPATILDRHAIRRLAGVPTVSVLVGPIGAGGGTWRRWATATGRSAVVANRDLFPSAEWVRAVVDQVDLPATAVQCLAQQAGRDPDEFLVAWRAKTSADREQFWSTLAPNADDELLRTVANLAVGGGSRSAVAASLSDLGEAIVPMILRLAPSTLGPSVLFVAGVIEDFLAVGSVAARWATRLPTVPLAIAVRAGVWEEFLTAAPESRAKALLREGELRVRAIDAATIERTLSEAGAVGSSVAALAPGGADAALVDAAAGIVRATVSPPTTEAEDERARSAAERFLYTFLESLPETAGRFELNASLDFHFGRRWAEVDLLCRSPRIAIELDGYFHFLGPDGYRRDRMKDWELQRRGYLVLRFLAEDVIPHLETIRDRILDALTVTPLGAQL